MVHLDRAFCNLKWLHLCPATNVRHLVRVSSDHCALSLATKAQILFFFFNKLRRPRMLSAWFKHEGFQQIVEQQCSNEHCNFM